MLFAPGVVSRVWERWFARAYGGSQSSLHGFFRVRYEVVCGVYHRSVFGAMFHSRVVDFLDFLQGAELWDLKVGVASAELRALKLAKPVTKCRT